MIAVRLPGNSRIRQVALTALTVLFATLPYPATAQVETEVAPLETNEGSPPETDQQVQPESVEIARPESVATVDTSDIVAEVLVSGEQPGPGLWRVVKDGHELWILGSHGPLPKKMTWRSKQVEKAIAGSQRVMDEGGVDAKPNIGIFRGLMLLPAAYAAAKNPDDEKLVDVLPADVYAQWTVLKQKYIGRDSGIEKWRPTFAMLQLRSKARAKVGFGNSSLVWDEVRKLARKHRIRIIPTSIEQEIRIEEPRKKLKQFAKVPFSDVECFSKSLAAMEGDLENLRLRANTWATGDLAALRSVPTRDPTTDCAQILGESLLSGEISPDADTTAMLQKIRSDIMQAETHADEKWLTIAKQSLAENASTFAVLPISKLIGERSPLPKLRADGYTVEEPIE